MGRLRTILPTFMLSNSEEQAQIQEWAAQNNDAIEHWSNRISGSSLVTNEGTTPPTSPSDGDIWIYPGTGFFWKFEYDSSEATYPWKFVGGPPLASGILTAENTGSAGYADMATIGPSVSLPRPGEYIASWGATFSAGAGAQAFSSLGGVVSDGTDEHASPASVSNMTHASVVVITVGAAGTLKMRYHSNSGSPSATFQWRWLSVVPRRLS